MKDDLQLISNNPISNEEIIQCQLNEIASYYENIPVGLALLNIDLRYIRINHVLAEMNGVPAEEHIGRTVGEVIPSLEVPSKQIANTIISTGKPVTGIEISGETVTQPGFQRTCLESWYPVWGNNNKIVGFTVIVQDITEQKQAEDTLRKTETQLNFVLESNNIGAWILNLADHTAYHTLTHDNIFGYDTLLPDWTYEKFIEHVLPEDRKYVDESFNEAISKQVDWKFKCRIRRVDGIVRWISVIGSNEIDIEGNPSHLLGIVQDITEHKQAEEKLHVSENLLKSLANNLPNVVLFQILGDWEGNRKFTYISDAVSRVNEVSVEAVMNDVNVLLSQMLPEYIPGLKMAEEKAAREGKTLHYEFQSRLPSGKIRWFQLSSFITVLSDKLGMSEGVQIDITERKQIEEALQKSEVKYRRLFESMTDAYAASDMKGRIIESNPAFQSMLGYSDEELKRMSYKDFTPQQWYDFESDIIRDQILTNKHSKLYEKEYIRRDGSIVPVELRTFIITDDAGQQIGLCAIVRDITDRKQAEERLNNYNAELEKQVAERTIVSENRARKLQTLSRRLIMAEETERQRIAYVLHEEVQQILVAARMALNTGITQIKDTASQAPLAVVDRMLSEAITETRELVHQIVPPAFYESGLQDAVIWLSKQMRERYDFAVDVITSDKITTIDHEVGICAYQAIREMLLNIHKHANVKQAEIIFDIIDDKRFKLTVRDKGIGYIIKDIQYATDPNKGFGLFSIRERVEGLGGGVEIISVPSKGTTITLYLPMSTAGTNKKSRRN
jgi:PAS domain S-box-containing protein